jgi:transposase-like protein
MGSLSAYEIYLEIKNAKKVEVEKLKAIVTNAHPDTIAGVFEMQRERVPCTVCNTVTNTDVHVEYRGGISVFTKYVCPRCKNEFMEKDLHAPQD